MQKRVIENLSERNLLILIGSLIFGLIVCSLIICQFIAPSPATSQIIPGTACRDVIPYTAGTDQKKWYYPHGEGACTLQQMKDYDENHTVYAFQMPLPDNDSHQGYSRWQQNLIGALQIDINSNNNQSEIIEQKTSVLLEAHLAYKNERDPDDDWKPYESSTQIRHLDCTKKDGVEHQYCCESIPLIKLTPLSHNYYLLNIRLLFDSEKYIDYIHNVNLIVINQSEKYAMAWYYWKLTLSVVVQAVLIWHCIRLRMLSRPQTLLENMLVLLGFALALLNLPLEYVMTVYYEAPSTALLLIDMRQSLFYATLFSFWLIFMGEHSIEDDLQRSSLKTYSRHLGIVISGFILLFSFNLAERVYKLKNPFSSIWIKDFGFDIALLFIILAVTLSSLYVIFLIYMLMKAIKNIITKKAELLNMNSSFHSHHEKILNRFGYFLFATLLCAVIVVYVFIFDQVSEGPWKWSKYIKLSESSVTFIVIYGVLNTYIITLLCLYVPSNKNFQPSQQLYYFLKERLP